MRVIPIPKEERYKADMEIYEQSWIGMNEFTHPMRLCSGYVIYRTSASNEGLHVDVV